MENFLRTKISLSSKTSLHRSGLCKYDTGDTGDTGRACAKLHFTMIHYVFMREILLVTSNRNKLREFEQILGFRIENAALDLDEIQTVEVEDVVEHKAKQAFERIKKPVLCEDTGLYFDEWNGLPGALMKWFGRTIGYENLCSLLRENRKARAKTVIGYFDGKNYESFKGEVAGTISLFPKGTGNFGWDPIFIPEGSDRTFAQMTTEEKNEISMRRIALEELKRFL